MTNEQKIQALWECIQRDGDETAAGAFGALRQRAEQAERERDNIQKSAAHWKEAKELAEADNAAKDKAFREYVEWHGVEHDSDCPEDDTCDCEFVVALNKAFGPDHPGAAMLERMLALEGLYAAAKEFCPCDDHECEKCSRIDAALSDVLAAKVAP